MKSFPELIVESSSLIERNVNIAVVGINPGEGTTTTAIATANILSQNLSKKVLLVDLNYYNPCLHSLFHINQVPGFTDILSSPNAPFVQNIHRNRNTFDIITCGDGDKQVIHGMLTLNFSNIIKRIGRDYDQVIFDVGSRKQATYTNNIISLFDGVILTIACESTKWEAARDEKDKLESAGANLLGVVMNKRKLYIPKWLYDSV